MAERKRQKKVTKMKRKTPVFTGFILLLFSIYLIVLSIQSATKEHISIYEVTEKKIADDNTVRGIILREEKLVNSSQSGYINYFVGGGAKVGIKTPVYSIDESGRIYDQLMATQNDDVKLTAQNTDDIRSEISAYRDIASLSHFEESYNFKYNMENVISRLSNARLMDNLTQILKESGSVNDFSLVKAQESGIVSYTSDGMEDLDLNSITKESFDDTTDKLTQLRRTESVEAGTPVYKLVTSENWSVIIPLSEEQFKNIQQEEKLTVSLKKIHARITPQITTFTMDGGYFAKLDMNRYMIQYLDNRYLELEIEMNNNEGLKIPLSSILKKVYFRIPKEYVTQDQKGNDGIVVVSYDKKGTPTYQFKASSVIYPTPSEEEAEEETAQQETEQPEDGAAENEKEEKQTEEFCYVDASQFDAGTSIALDNLGSGTLQLKDTEELEGVYCCNKGYCEFRRVEQSYKNAEYCIVKKDTPNGLAAYDHIILNPELIGENDIIY